MNFPAVETVDNLAQSAVLRMQLCNLFLLCSNHSRFLLNLQVSHTNHTEQHEDDEAKEQNDAHKGRMLQTVVQYIGEGFLSQNLYTVLLYCFFEQRRIEIAFSFDSCSRRNFSDVGWQRILL